MPGQARISDIAKAEACSHGCPSCPHKVSGPIVGGSPNVFVNGLPAARLNDPGIHAACCGTNIFTCDAGSGTVFINGKKAHRKGDKTKHCGTNGKMTSGSANVLTGG